MSVLYSSNFRFQDGELRKNQGIMDTNFCNLQQSQHNNSDLTRYNSAPSSFVGNLVNGSVTTTTGPGFEDYQSSSPEMETLFMLSSDMQEYHHEEKSVKQEEAMYQSLPAVQDADSMECSFGFSGSLGLENSIGNGNSSNLARQSSSPADFFSNLTLDNGFNVIRKATTFQGCNGTIDETASTGSKLYDSHISFSSRPSPCSRPMVRIAKVENESGRVSNGNGSSTGHFIPNLRTDSWNMLKRGRESTDGDIFCGGLSRSETQNQNFKDRSTALTHHLSLPKTSTEMAEVQKLWQFQGSVPCKTRAKRGCATHPRSIAERVRRTRISERMRKLQGLFPNMDKQTNTADMLDMAVEYIKDLQKQVKTLTDTKANCSCSCSKKNKTY